MKIICFCGEKLVYAYRVGNDEYQIKPCQKCIAKAINDLREEALKIMEEI